MPHVFVTRSLEEVRFWCRMMKEHALLVRYGFTGDQRQQIQEADRCFYVFEEVEERLYQFNERAEPETMVRFNMEIYQAASNLWGFTRKVLSYSLSRKLITHHYPLLIDHMSRETAYFMNRIELLNKGTFEIVRDNVITENIFYLRLMADHAKFFGHMIDPSERDLVTQASDFSYQFDQLLLSAVDLESMRPYSQKTSILERFIAENRNAVVSFQEYKQTVRELAHKGRVRGTLHPAFAAQMAREADYCLSFLDACQQVILLPPGPESQALSESSSSSAPS
jgi:hypothetical protein